MLGADVGTTLVAQVFAFDIKWLWAAGLFVGVILFSAAGSDRVKSVGRIAIGLGTDAAGAFGALRRVGAHARKRPF